jgi:hypothetical protein
MPSLEQQAIAEHMRSVAAWRRAKMQEFDPDPRNLRSAAGLEELAEHVLALPEEDERIQTLVRLTFVGQMFQPGQMTTWEIPRFRFYHEESSPDAFLTHLVELAEKDAVEDGHFGGRLPEGDDPWTARNVRTRIYIVEVEEPDEPAGAD